MPFLKANSPAPFPHPTNYRDFTYTSVETTYESARNRYLYETTITNTGDGYIDLFHSGLYSYDVFIASPSFVETEYLGPAQSASITFSHAGTFSGLSVICDGFTLFADFITYTTPTLSAKTHVNAEVPEHEPLYEYTYDSTFTGMKKGYYYMIFVDFTYEEKLYTATHNRSQDSDKSFLSKLDMDLEKITINRLTFIQGRGSSDLGKVLTLIFGLTIAGFYFILFIFAVVILAVILLIKGYKKKKATQNNPE